MKARPSEEDPRNVHGEDVASASILPAIVRVPEPFELVSLPWESQGGRWSLSVCLRATFTVVHAGPCEAAEPLSMTHTVDGSWDEAQDKLQRLADHAPFKPRADVLVVGHAYSPWETLVRGVHARVRVGDVSKAIRVTGDRVWRWKSGQWQVSDPKPFAKMPLRWEGANRSADVPVGIDPAAPPVDGSFAAPTFEAMAPKSLPGLGPIPPGWPQRYGLVDEAALEWALGFAGGGAVPGGPPPRFPFQFFNVAPPDQQLDVLRPGTPLVLEHLSLAHPMVATHLPAIRPRVHRLLGGRRAEVALRCDTLWIDTDRGTITLLWRGLVDIDGPRDKPDLAVTVEGDSRSRAPAAPVTAAASRLEQTQDVPVVAVDRAMAALPFAGDEGGLDDGSTTSGGALGTVGSASAPPLPPPRVSAPSSPGLGSDGAGGLGGTMRLRTADVPVPPAARAVPSAPPARIDTPARIEVPARIDPPPPARIDTPAPARLENTPPPTHIGARAVDKGPSIPTSEGKTPEKPVLAPPPDIATEISPPPVMDPDAIDLRGSARIAAALAMPGADRATVLAGYRLEDAGWTKVDRKWKQAIDQDARKGSMALLGDYDDAFLEGLAERGKPIDVAAYARISVAQKRGDLADVLESLSFPRTELLRLTRVWTRRTKADKALADELAAAVTAEEARG